MIFKNIEICHECLLELKPVFNVFKIGNIKATNVYWYTEETQNSLYQLKGCSDYEIRNIFLDYYWEYFRNKYSSFIVIPAPSSKEANEKRGFNQVEAIFGKLRLPTWCCIHKTTDFKQHELNSLERSESKKLFEIDNVNLKHKKVLLVDDVYTTGSTINAMIELVKTKKPRYIEVLVMSKTIDLDLR